MPRLIPRRPVQAAEAPVVLAVEVSPVRTPAERERFINFQIELYRTCPQFVPPIVAERKDFLDPLKNPFLAHAEVELFLATRGGVVVGRAAAIDDPHYNQFHNTEFGFFGMFDCVDDAEVAQALLAACARWVKSRGMKSLVGPVNFS